VDPEDLIALGFDLDAAPVHADPTDRLMALRHEHTPPGRRPPRTET
jgi:hypothetical protein